MKKKAQLLILIMFSAISISLSQTIEKQKAKEAADYISTCTKNSLIKNGIDVVKLVEIVNSYRAKNILLDKYRADAKKISKQLDAKYSMIESDIYECKSAFKQKFKPYLKNKTFNEELQIKLNNDPYQAGPKIIKNLTSNL